MKVALIVAGYLRSYKSNLKYIQEAILDKFGDVDIYLHITKDESTEDKYLNQIKENDIKYIIDTLNPRTTIIENNTYYSDNKVTNNVLNHWAKLYKLKTLKSVRESEVGKYDLVIRYRPDVSIATHDIFKIPIEEKTVHIPKESKMDKKKLSNPSDKYLCDAIAFGDSESMDKYFNIYEHLDKDIDSASETVLHNYMVSNSIKHKLVDIDYEFILSKCNIFGICGDSGSGKSTLAGMLKKFFSNSFALECDRYHKWERGDEKWEEYTHLNPDANYITKMNEDIFNLKLGNSIYQVDYDHKTGTFTESQLIEPSENTIVCGLHSLYSKDDHLYNLKIFIDTDEQLKTQWKIQRDVNERGHTLEKVLDQISKRKGDYEKYIHPQRDNSDLVVKFFLDKEGNTQLQLSVHTKHDIGNILETLRRCEVGYEVGSQGDFTSITFLKYKDKSLWEDPTTPVYHNYYDYVIYFILNLGLEV
jgi:uridine kinase